MTFEIFLVLALLAGAMAFFTFEWLPIDVVTLSLLVALVVSGILSPEEAFAGFANEIIIVLGSVFVLSGALVKTGVMDWLGQAIFRLAGSSRTRVLLVVTTLSASMSALVSNTNSTAVLMPAAFELAKKGRFSPSRLLMPLAFASILGGTCTLIGTSTNIAASGMLKKLGYAPYGFFEFTAVGLVIVVTGILYLAFVGYRLLPARPAASLSEKYDIGAYLSAVVVAEGSSLDGKALRDAGLADLGMHVAAIKRDGRRFFPRRDTILRAGDLLVVEATRESLLATKESADLHLETDSVLGDADLETEGAKLVEAFVAPSSDIADRTLSEIGFRSRFRVAVLALYRRGHARPTDLRHLPLRVGDVLLLQGSEGDLDSLHKSGDLWLLDEVAHVPFRRRRGLFAAAALAVAVLAGSLGLLPLSVALLTGALAVVIRKCITAQEVYDLIQWRLLILIGGMTSFGLAMQKTSAAEYVADLIVSWAMPVGIYAVLATLSLLTMLLTQPLSNAAAVLVILPVAVSTAVQMGVNPRTFAVLVTLSASLSFITPFEPACLLVYGPGGYRFSDFVRSGTVLSLVAFALLLLLVPRIWPL